MVFGLVGYLCWSLLEIVLVFPFIVQIIEFSNSNLAFDILRAVNRSREDILLEFNGVEVLHEGVYG